MILPSDVDDAPDLVSYFRARVDQEGPLLDGASRRRAFVRARPMKCRPLRYGPGQERGSDVFCREISSTYSAAARRIEFVSAVLP